jgi:hypothetical protein
VPLQQTDKSRRPSALAKFLLLSTSADNAAPGTTWSGLASKSIEMVTPQGPARASGGGAVVAETLRQVNTSAGVPDAPGVGSGKMTNHMVGLPRDPRLPARELGFSIGKGPVCARCGLAAPLLGESGRPRRDAALGFNKPAHSPGAGRSASVSVWVRRSS